MYPSEDIITPLPVPICCCLFDPLNKSAKEFIPDEMAVFLTCTTAWIVFSAAAVKLVGAYVAVFNSNSVAL